jgi:hypothetical protein
MNASIKPWSRQNVVEVIPDFEVTPCKPAVLAMKEHDAHEDSR